MDRSISINYGFPYMTTKVKRHESVGQFIGRYNWNHYRNSPTRIGDLLYFRPQIVPRNINLYQFIQEHPGVKFHHTMVPAQDALITEPSAYRIAAQPYSTQESPLLSELRRREQRLLENPSLSELREMINEQDRRISELSELSPLPLLPLPPLSPLPSSPPLSPFSSSLPPTLEPINYPAETENPNFFEILQQQLNQWSPIFFTLADVEYISQQQHLLPFLGVADVIQQLGFPPYPNRQQEELLQRQQEEKLLREQEEKIQSLFREQNPPK